MMSCLNTRMDSRQEMATPAMVMPAAAARPIQRPKRPAMMAATSGRSGMASSRDGFSDTELAFERTDVGHVDAVALPEQHHQDGETDRRLGGRHRQHEEHEHLAIDSAEVAREGDEVEVRRQQQQLNAHQQQDDV